MQLQRPLLIGSLAIIAVACARIAPGSRPAELGQAADYRTLDQQFARDVQPVLQKYCLGCHSGAQPASGLDLAAFGSTSEVVDGFGIWEHVYDRLSKGEMPPRQMPQPTEAERELVIGYITALRDHEAARNAGDPGLVLAHRLSNAELNYTIFDLTGFDIQPAKEFPVDPANEAGFDNSGETLALSPALLNRYLDAARNVAEHIVFTPKGFAFAPHVVVSEPDRDRYVVNRIMDFYGRQPTDLADYFFALWRLERGADRGDAALAQIAREEKVSAGYLKQVRDFLALDLPAVGPVGEVERMWNTMRVGGSAEAARAASQQIGEYIVASRQKLGWRFDVPRANPLHIASQTVVMQANRLQASHRRKLNPAYLVASDSPLPGTDPVLVIPEAPDQQAAALAALTRFCDLFPDAFLISERTSTWLAANQSGRLLSAGFHSMMGYFRDDRPLYDLILDDAGRRELDSLWEELDFISDAPKRQLSGFVWFERTDSPFMLSEEFNHIRSEDHDLGSPAKFADLRNLYLKKVAASNLRPGIQDTVKLFFDELESAIRTTERLQKEAEPYHLESLVAFAEKAYRRPLTTDEREDLLAFYQQLRTEEELSHEDAIRDAVMSVLVSPNFSFRVDLAQGENRNRVGSQAVAPLTDYALASRLSYFLWSSMPDGELLSHAAAGDLHQQDVLRAQVRRMLGDEKSRRLATEFATNWLGVRRFEEFNSVGRERFPMFTNDLRQAFFEEPIYFFTDIIRNDRSVMDLLFADYTFVNAALAAHYGMPAPKPEDGWVKVDNASQYERGGLLPMAVFLTNYSTGLRTSPVKRGHWVASKVLGQHIPAPPPNVPQLPADEADLGELTLSETMARHRADPTCASCHATFDHFGLVFEGFGPVGERRQKDLGGRVIEVTAQFPNGKEESGLQGLREYLRDERQDDFVDNITRRMLSYGLGRGLLVSDESLIKQAEDNLAANDYRFSSLIETIVTSPQFLTKRVSDDTGSSTITPLARK